MLQVNYITWSRRGLLYAAGKEPVVLAGLSNVNANSGKSVKLECDVMFGKPKAEVKWWDFGGLVVLFVFISLSFSFLPFILFDKHTRTVESDVKKDDVFWRWALPSPCEEQNKNEALTSCTS